MKKFIVLFLLAAMAIPGIVLAAENGLSARLKGRILLQVEKNGEAWYVNPVDGERYYLGRPDDAFKIMRELGLGISELDFSKWGETAPARLAGRIVLRVQRHGEAYYIEPIGYKLRYLGRPGDAFELMRGSGLGISNSDLSAIKIRENYGLPAAPALPAVPEIPGDPTIDNSGDQDESSQADEENSENSGDQATSSDENTSNDNENSSSTPAIGAENCLFKADYHFNAALSGFPYSSAEEYGIDHEWGNEAPEALGGRYDLFSVRWTGECYFEEGEYEFTAVFDDGLKAYFDDTSWLFNNWKNNGRTVEMSHIRDIEEGYHKIKVEYYDNKHNSVIKFDWRKI
jgi:hypothetical protein